MQADQLVAALGACQSPDPAVRKAAEEALNQVGPGHRRRRWAVMSCAAAAAAARRAGGRPHLPPGPTAPPARPLAAAQACEGPSGEPAACGAGGQRGPGGAPGGRHLFQKPGQARLGSRGCERRGGAAQLDLGGWKHLGLRYAGGLHTCRGGGGGGGG